MAGSLRVKDHKASPATPGSAADGRDRGSSNPYRRLSVRQAAGAAHTGREVR